MPSDKPDYVMVADLQRFQHYRDRCPPWVKVHWAMLDDPRFMDLSEANRHRYIMCILIASRVENRIKNDPLYLARMMRLSEPVDITPLISSGLLLAYRKPSASAAQAKRSSEERERRGETKKRLRTVVKNGRRGGMEDVGTSVRSIIESALNGREREVIERHPHLRDVEGT